MSLFSMIGSMGATALNNDAAEDRAIMNNNYAKSMQAAQNRFNLDMWNKNNEYNSPEQQVQRLVDAGLSPNLAYGSVSTGNSSSPPVQGAAHQSAPELHYDNVMKDFNILGDYLQLATLGEKVKQSKLDTELKSEQVGKTAQEKENAAALLDKIVSERENIDSRTSLNELTNMDLLASIIGMSLQGDFDRGDFHVYRSGINSLRDLYGELKDNNLVQYYKKVFEKGLEASGLQNQILESTRDQQKTRKRLLDLDEEFYKIDKYFNYFDRSLKDVIDIYGTFKGKGLTPPKKHLRRGSNGRPQWQEDFYEYNGF